MSQTLYMVRLREVLRVRFDYYVRVERTKPHAIFSARSQAEQYILSHTPIDCNPFARDIEAFFIDIENQKITIHEYEEDSPTQWQCSWLDVVDAIQDAGAKMPDVVWPEGWEPWWDTLTPSQQLQLRLALELPEWSENPFTMADIYIEGDFYMSYAVPLCLLDKRVSEWGLILPVFTEAKAFGENERRMVRWWEENASQMTEEQKTSLWHLMDLQPFEIVEVPLT